MTNHIVLIVTAMVFVSMMMVQYQKKNGEVTYVESMIDNKKYLVRNLPDKQKAADVLARTKTILQQLCDTLKENHPESHPVKRLNERFNSDNITESSANSKYTSYSINKGEKIVLCLRSRDDKEKLIDVNTLVFVAIHELAHLATDEIGHTPKFWDNFRFLLKESIKHGLYKKQDFKNNPKPYCGIYITDSPLDK